MQLYFGNMKYLSIVVIATWQFIFFSVFFSKKAQKSVNAKNISFNLGIINKYLFYHPYVTMPNVGLNLV